MFCAGTRDSRVASYWIDTLVLKNRGKYLRYFAASPFPLQGKTNACSRGSKKDFGAVAGEIYTQVKTYQVPIINSSPSHYIIFHLPLVFLSPTSHLPFRRLFSVRLFLLASCCLFALMALPKNVDPYLKRLEEIENNIRSFMSLQFEHNNFFRNELKEQKGLLVS